MDATSDNERRSVATSRNFSAPSLIYSEIKPKEIEVIKYGNKRELLRSNLPSVLF